MGRTVRIGIDVGGTFTDAVAIDNITHEIIAEVKIPTTHNAKRGVAEGIIIALEKVMREHNIDPSDVVFIAHGTTQATNALLEGDVATVGIVGMGQGLEGRRAQKETKIGEIELAPKKYLHTYHTYLDTGKCSDADVETAILSLKEQGAQVIVASEAYSVDDPTNEQHVVKIANDMGMPATGGYEISQLYGLLARSRTAAVNAALIPKMMETADMTYESVRQAHIDKPLMIMRCDGGVMSADEVRKRPILTMLSGLAAGVAGALMYEKITDGIFMEIGGTSVDISAIKDGKVMIKNAQVGGHNLYLTSLDVRTLGVAGGSMIVVQDEKITDVGPRSAHIAQLEYEAFKTVDDLLGAKLRLISPHSDDACVYASVCCDNGNSYALTLAGAANILGYVPQGDYAQGDAAAARIAWQALADATGMTVEQACTSAMDIAAEKISVVINALINDYQLSKSLIHLVGGGGSAGVLTQYLGDKMGLRHRIAKSAPYISTIGVAMAMVMERLERNIVHPTPDDIRRLRSDILEMVTKAGANPSTVDITVEIDAQKNILRAVATGATELRTKNLSAQKKTPQELLAVVCEGAQTQQVTHLYTCGSWHAYSVAKVKKALFGLLKTQKSMIYIVDEEGVIRLQKNDASAIALTKEELLLQLPTFVDDMTTYNDGGAMLPKTFLYFRQKAVDLSGVNVKEQLMPLVTLELEFVDNDEIIIAVAARS